MDTRDNIPTIIEGAEIIHRAPNGVGYTASAHPIPEPEDEEEGEVMLDQDALLHATIRRANRNGTLGFLRLALIELVAEDFVKRTGRLPDAHERKHLRRAVTTQIFRAFGL